MWDDFVDVVHLATLIQLEGADNGDGRKVQEGAMGSGDNPALADDRSTAEMAISGRMAQRHLMWELAEVGVRAVHDARAFEQLLDVGKLEIERFGALGRCESDQCRCENDNQAIHGGTATEHQHESVPLFIYYNYKYSPEANQASNKFMTTGPNKRQLEMAFSAISKCSERESDPTHVWHNLITRTRPIIADR